MELLDIRPRRPELPVSSLSGGNQQKVILAKWLAREVQVLAARRADAWHRHRRQDAGTCADPQIHQRRRRGDRKFERSVRTCAHLRQRAHRARSRHHRPHRTQGRRGRDAGRGAICAPRSPGRARHEAFVEHVSRLLGSDAAADTACALRGDDAADRPVSVADQSQQHPGAIVDHGSDRDGHDFRDHRRRLRPVGRLDRGACRPASPPWSCCRPASPPA